MSNRKRAFSLVLAFIVPMLILWGLLLTLNSQAATADSTEPSPPQPNLLLEAIRQGKYPAQLAGHSGAIRPDRHGPQRNDTSATLSTSPAEGIPAHAYSPFDEVRNREYPCPPGGCEFQKGQVLVKLASQVRLQRPDLKGAWTEDAALNEALQAQGVLRLEPVFPNARPPKPGEFVVSPQGERLPKPDLTRWHRTVLTDEKADVYSVVQALSETPGIAWAEPDYLRRPAEGPESKALHPSTSAPPLLGTPTDPLYDQQWHLDATNVPAAWQWLEDNGYTPGGSRDVVVAVIDTGVDYDHPDLAANMWVNATEFSGSPGVDDDGNGYVDDIYGADTVYPDGDPQDDHGHGTHVAGIVAAQANNSIGGVGAAYNVQLMALKAAQYSGVLASSDIAEAIYYAVEKGADVLNMSFGGYTRSQVEEDALAVAFGQAVLVAAAGNDGKVNLPCPFGRDMYPAAYNWVLGVMASTSSGSRAAFSNYDCTPHDSHEYELLAPGVDVWSTLPIENYAAWDGTSMATPIVSGIAALLRTRWSDKDVYSSRFIMGQIAANASPVADAYAALTIAPQPELSYLEHWLFDTEEQSPDNDDDGIVDAGETIDLAIVIRNHWGKADPVTVTLEAWAEGAVFPDPYVTMITGTVSYGAVGSFNWDDNGLIYDDEGVITGVRHPFRFTVPITTPNDHVIPFLLTMIAGNGYDPDDPNAPYVFQSRFYLIVQRGTELPTIISEDMVLTKDYYWIVPGQTLIENGATVTVTEGTQVQWGAPDPDDPYGEGSNAYIQVEGKLSAQGTYTEPVEFFPSGILGGYVSIQTSSSTGTTELEYVRVRNPKVGRGTYEQASLIDHGYFDGDRSGSISSYYLRNSIVHKIPSMEHDIQSHHIWISLLDSLNRNWGGLSIGYYGTETIRNSVFLQDNQNNAATSLTLKNGVDENSFARFFFPEAYGGKTYVAVFGSNITLDAAESIADYFNGHVVSINDDAENTYLANYVNTYLTSSAIEAEYGNPCLDWSCPGNYQEARIGLSDVENEGDFIWISGEPVVYSNWRAGEPDDTNRWGSPGADYVVLASDSTWFDNTDQTNNFIVLELPGEVSQATLDDSLDDLVIEVASVSTVHVRNAFLSKYWDPDVNHWMRVSPYYQRGRNWYMGIANNYWGTTSTTLIDAAITDFNDDFNKAHIVYQPILTTPVTTTYPFVVDVTLSTASDPDASIVGAETVTFTVTFNRNMDTTVQPAVSFGPDVPETDYTVHPLDGGWQDARTWVGTFNITPITGDGYQLMRIADAVAADDPWLVTGDDVERFRFEIITSGTESMNLQANGGEGYVDLSWTQDDFDLLAGFNLYRSTSQDGTYTRLNTSIIPPDQRTYRDTNVQPGQPYYYYFTVVKSDMTESDPSNIATATPVDTVSPVISHTPVTQAPPGLPLTLFADVTDNVGVQGVALYYRAIGETTYSNEAMVHTTGNRYSATIEGSLVASPGLEYYIEATDGVSTVRDGRPEHPHQITVEDKPVVTTVSPNHGPASGGTAVTISGSNFKDGASVTFGGAVAEDATVVSSSQMTCTTPAHYPAMVDVRVTNPDTQSGTLLRGFTYESDVASLSLPDTGGGQHDIVQAPVNAANVQGLAAADLTITFDQAVLSARDASTGNLTPGWSVVANTNTPGEIRVSMASPGGTVSGSGVLAYLEFEVVGSPGASTALQLTNASLNDGAIPVETADGSFTVSLVYDIAGTVRFWQNSAGVPDVLLTLEGDRVYTGQSDANGDYTVSGAETDDYTLTPSKLDEVNGISAYDASLALQHSAGLTTLTGHAATAADVNKSGAITSMDAFYILQKAVELITLPFPGAGVVWDFDPPSRSYANLSSDQTGQDFTAVLLGDVSGNWSAELGQALPQATGTASLTLPDLYAEPGERITVTLDMALDQAQVYGADIVASYDPTVVSAASVSADDAAQDFMTASNLNPPGQVQVAMAGAQPITDDGRLLTLVFDVMGKLGDTSLLQITTADLNEGGVITQRQDGSVSVVDLPDHDFNRDCIVNVADVMRVASRWRCRSQDACYDECYDIDHDGDIDIVDIMKVVANWGATCW